VEVAGADDDETVVVEGEAAAVVEVTVELLAVPNCVELEHPANARIAQYVAANHPTRRGCRSMYVCVFIVSSRHRSGRVLGRRSNET
jgi:hypothetical protein